MTILLTTPANPGDNDPGATYPRAKIVHLAINFEEEMVALIVGFGDVVDVDGVPTWVEGKNEASGQPGCNRQYHTIQKAGVGTLFGDVVAKGEAWLNNQGHAPGVSE